MQNNLLQIMFHIVQHSIASHLRSTEWAKEKWLCFLDSAVLRHVMEREGALGKCGTWALGDASGHSSKAGSLNSAWPERGSKNPPFLFYYIDNIQSRIISAAENGISHSGRWQSSWFHCGLCLGTEFFGTVLLIYKMICSDTSYIK